MVLGEQTRSRTTTVCHFALHRKALCLRPCVTYYSPPGRLDGPCALKPQACLFSECLGEPVVVGPSSPALGSPHALDLRQIRRLV